MYLVNAMGTFEPLSITLAWTVLTRSTQLFCEAHDLPHPPVHFPLLVDRTGRIVESVRAYMWHKYVLRVLPPLACITNFSTNTHRACAYDLCHFFDSLDEAEIRLEDIDEEVINTFSAAHDGKSPATGNFYKRSTAMRRMATVTDFVSWLQGQGRLRRRIDFSHVSAGTHYVQAANISDEEDHRRRKEAKGKPANIVFHVMKEREAEAILNELGRNVCHGPDQAWHVSYLGTLIALITGMRLNEVRTLDLCDITQHASNVADNTPLYPFHVAVMGKGEVRRYVEFPGWLIKKLIHYVETDRANAVRAGKALYGKKYSEQQALLLNSPSVTRNRGMRIGVGSIYNRFHSAVVSLHARGLISKVFCFHDCRHTFATWTGLKYEDSGKINPHFAVKNLLGHRDVSTTINVYQNTMQMHRKSISEDIQKQLSILAHLAEKSEE